MAREPLPDNLIAAGESRIDEGTPTTQPKTFMPTRKQFEDIYRAARAVTAEHATELPAGYTLVRSTLLRDLRLALESVNVDV